MNNSKETKIDLEQLDRLLEDSESPVFGIKFDKLIPMVVLNWQYFLLSMIIFVSGAIIYLRYTDPSYKLSARMLIKDERKQNSNASQLLSSLTDLGFVSNSAGIDNEVEVLQSRILMRDVVRELHLNVEYRFKARIKNELVYRKQPVSVELDPVVLDSLDKDYIDWSEISNVQMEITREKDGYFVKGRTHHSGNEKGSRDHTFQKKIDSLPASVSTVLGTLTLTASDRFQMQAGETYTVTILPPMLVAANYLSAVTVEPTSKRTDIAMITLIDKNSQRGMDFLRRLAVCYNRRANADKNEVALRTEEFIKERVKKINEELGLTEDELANYKRSHAVTGLSVDATQAVQLSNQFSARLSDANAQIRLIDYLREYVGNPRNKYQVIPSNVGLTDGATTQLINDYNRTVLNRNRLLTVANEEAPQVQTLTATIDDMAAGPPFGRHRQAGYHGAICKIPKPGGRSTSPGTGADEDWPPSGGAVGHPAAAPTEARGEQYLARSDCRQRQAYRRAAQRRNCATQKGSGAPYSPAVGVYPAFVHHLAHQYAALPH